MMAQPPYRKPFTLYIQSKIQSGLRFCSEIWFRQGTLILGRYHIQQRLGRGNYGVAYLCKDQHTGQPCVLKRISPLKGSKSRSRWIYDQETNMLGRLNHLGIPTLLEPFTYRQHLSFTMQYMEGENLATLLFHKNCTYTELESLQLISKLLEVIGYIHSVGVVHRDISLTNVIVAGDMVKLIDWGLARDLRGVTPNENDLEPLEIEGGHASENVLRRRLHRSSDFYAIGHLLLFLLYSTYTEDKNASTAKNMGWDEELNIHPHTKRLLRCLLEMEQPFGQAQDIILEIQRILQSLTDSD
ncbi:serine/threonine protein kinase [Paenibacillus agricola]|uniref:Protein kinase family protein n=1 Tax=Paenibacillus agricola TaxID=2716264 RepID=A0ABX0JGI9_9BACL|nr:protein kinase family protein [Paenibacillus agricola]NHN34495.1 protein kinase family protein [Paenibacillus agricola]